MRQPSILITIVWSYLHSLPGLWSLTQVVGLYSRHISQRRETCMRGVEIIQVPKNGGYKGTKDDTNNLLFFPQGVRY
ncbi:hypothetical protein F4814DRAFT_156078 [Daldinia grandis]|nr:hypothetical protein F4814DRAFT_156078 [Daldinia grandis]